MLVTPAPVGSLPCALGPASASAKGIFGAPLADPTPCPSAAPELARLAPAFLPMEPNLNICFHFLSFA